MDNLTLTAAEAMSTAALLQALAEALALADEGFRQACVAVAVLEAREVALPVLPAPYRYAREVAEGRLAPRAALTAPRRPDVLRALMQLPADMQNDAVDGTIRVPVTRDPGQFCTIGILDMTPSEVGLAFHKGRMYLDDAGAVLEIMCSPGKKAPTAPPASFMQWDVATGEVTVRGCPVRREDLVSVIEALGYMVRRHGPKPMGKWVMPPAPGVAEGSA